MRKTFFALRVSHLQGNGIFFFVDAAHDAIAKAILNVDPKNNPLPNFLDEKRFLALFVQPNLPHGTIPLDADFRKRARVCFRNLHITPSLLG